MDSFAGRGFVLVSSTPFFPALSEKAGVFLLLFEVLDCKHRPDLVTMHRVGDHGLLPFPGRSWLCGLRCVVALLCCCILNIVFPRQLAYSKLTIP